jgi:hypothetical protein
MRRTKKKDALERAAIKAVEKVVQAGGIAHLFEYEEILIQNPFLDESGRFKVDPVKNYGSIYEEWYENLV